MKYEHNRKKNKMKIIMLAGKGDSSKYIYNSLSLSHKIDKVLIVDSPSRKKLFKRRIKNLGFLNTINQLFFQLLVVKTLKVFTGSKYENYKHKLELDDSSIPQSKTIEVGSVNSKKSIETIKELNPDVIIVNGTAIISSKVLNSTDGIFINTHVGITPEYRGIHGGYWALINNDVQNFGVTVHVVDKGIDTGSIIYQKTTKIGSDNNFLTYPLHQYKLALPLLKKALDNIKNNQLKTYKKEGAISRLYYHPTFTSYIYGWIFKGVK